MAHATPDQVDALLLFVCGALVLLAAFGLAFFAGGMAGRARAARALRFALVGVAVVVLLAVLGGYGMIVGRPLIPHLVGRPDLGMASIAGPDAAASSPYRLARAGYLVALLALCTAVVGVAVASRLTLRAWIVFTVLWFPLVLVPVAYGVFALDDGWAVAGLSVVDFGGSLAVLAAGGSAVGILLACGRGEHLPTHASRPSLVAIGGALVWVGWLGLIVGSEGALDAYAPLMAFGGFLASATGVLMWMLVDAVVLRRPTLTSAVCGALAGLVGATAASGVLTLGWSMLVGALSALACATMVDLAARARFGPALTISVVTIVGSLVGLLFPGLFAIGGGMVDSGNFDLFIAQGIAGMSVLLYATTVSLLLALALRFTVGLTRVRYGAVRGIREKRPVGSGSTVPSVADGPDSEPAR
ncbi:ammonium transporter [Leifsonia sp. 21MFCrub1.1]|uniref:ammonium transporter n=1 Tax=Leifsonia sp. 21MFCrub1.1 TaxID=1798223 RepID=UPI00089288AB|nr:ammonium transporter [Leifsonia sp. 21MFCrub1.1]SEA75659.1 ammonium transporter [Leifsonia sp. 21MFCrub1.1]